MKKINKKEIKLLQKYWDLNNYIALGQLYLLDNPLLNRKLQLSDIKKKLVGHWGTIPGQTLIYTHLNRIIKKYDLNMIYVCGPGHGGNALTSATYIEGSYTEIYPDITQDEEGLKKLMKRFSFPKGVSSHASPELPGSINEGGELGYSLSHAYGAVLDNPNLIAACVIGDGEAETGPLAGSWHINKFLNNKKDGNVLPILHLNGAKINNPTVLSNITNDELYSYFFGLGYNPYYVEYENNNQLHIELAKAMDIAVEDIKKIKKSKKRHLHPMIILKTPKGISAPEELTKNYKIHQIPLDIKDEESVLKLEKWLKSYKPEELFNKDGSIQNYLKELNPSKNKLMGLNPSTNGGIIRKTLKYPTLSKHELKFKERGKLLASDTQEMGSYLRELMDLNDNFRIFGPDEALSNRFGKVFETQSKNWQLTNKRKDPMLSTEGKVLDSLLSEHVCEGALEGYILSGRYGLMHSYEAFINVASSMTTIHGKWLKMSKELPWRKDISSLNYILSSHTWQQDHNGYTHQNPGFLNTIINLKDDSVGLYFPVDANSLITAVDKVVKSTNMINAIVASKHVKEQFLSMKEAKEHIEKGISIWDWASINPRKKPNIVVVTCGDTPNIESLAAITILKEHNVDIDLRFINIIDLMKLSNSENSLSKTEFNKLFPKDIPVLFNFHGYPSLIKQLLFDRNISSIKINGYQEEGTITTSFDMRVLNKIDRYNQILDILSLTKIKNKELEKHCKEMLVEHNNYIVEYGIDMDVINNINFKSLQK